MSFIISKVLNAKCGALEGSFCSLSSVRLICRSSQSEKNKDIAQWRDIENGSLSIRGRVLWYYAFQC